MILSMKALTFLLFTLGVMTSALPLGQESQQEQEEVEDIPYSFSYAAARHIGGHPDREHKEIRGLDGITRGVYRYVDADQKVQEVVYHSDDDGFHVSASNIPEDTPVVAGAKSRHQKLFEKIASEHARIGEELRLAAENDQSDEEITGNKKTSSEENVNIKVFKPKQSVAVASATEKHHRLFEEISRQNSNNATPKVFLPKESAAVKNARLKHQKLFEITIADHAEIVAELEKAQKEYEEQQALKKELEEKGEELQIDAPYEEPEEKFERLSQYLPKNSRAVAARRKTHQKLYNKTIDQHRRLAAELEEKQRIAQLSQSKEEQ